MKINEKQLDIVFDMQNNMNKTVSEDWLIKGWDYMRASMIESIEAIEHHGWKWWKKQTIDLPQLQMELVDIFHFYLSRYLQLSNGDQKIAKEMLLKDLNHTSTIFDGKVYTFENLNPLEQFDLLTGLCAAKRLDASLFFYICKEFNLDWNNLYKQYIQKNILNIFRQKHGYKSGTYQKNWFGQEDNIYLVQEANKLQSSDDNYVSNLWNALEQIYQQATSKSNLHKNI